PIITVQPQNGGTSGQTEPTNVAAVLPEPAGLPDAVGHTLPTPAPKTPAEETPAVPVMPAVEQPQLPSALPPAPAAQIEKEIPNKTPPAPEGAVPGPAPTPIPAKQETPAPAPVVQPTIAVDLAPKAPAVAISGPTVTSRSEMIHTCDGKLPDFAAVSKQFYYSDKYAQALLEYNRDHPLGKDAAKQPSRLQAGMKVVVPSLEALEAEYPQLIQSAQACPNPAAAKVEGGQPATMVPVTTAPPAALPPPAPGPAPANSGSVAQLPAQPIPAAPQPKVSVATPPPAAGGNPPASG